MSGESENENNVSVYNKKRAHLDEDIRTKLTFFLKKFNRNEKFERAVRFSCLYTAKTKNY